MWRPLHRRQFVSACVHRPYLVHSQLLVLLCNPRVDPLRVGHVLEHHLGVVQLGLAEAQLEQLEVAQLALDAVVEVGEDAVGQQRAVLVDKQLLAAVDVHQHADDVRRPAALRRARCSAR